MKLIILDRDGVINDDSDEYIKSPEEWIAIPGSLEAISRLNKAGFTIAVATNQSGIGRGYYDQETLEKIHSKMKQQLSIIDGHIDRIFFCPHIPDDDCNCRKPKPGLLEQIAKHYQIALNGVLFIGDTLRDIKAARTMGCQPILLLTGYGEKTLQDHPEEVDNVPIFPDLAAAVTKIVGDKS